MDAAVLFQKFWWLIFPIFGMVIGIWAMIFSARRAREAMGLIKSYLDQGKDPPQELLDIAAGGDADFHAGGFQSKHSNVWACITFTALAAGFGTGYYAVQGQSYAFAFLIVAVIMGVLALGAFMMIMFSNKADK